MTELAVNPFWNQRLSNYINKTSFPIHLVIFVVAARRTNIFSDDPIIELVLDSSRIDSIKFPRIQLHNVQPQMLSSLLGMHGTEL